MKCSIIKKWIHLNNPGGLDDREKHMLEEHLRICSSCRELISTIESTDLLIQKLKNIEPELTYPQVLTSNIMQSITNSEKTNKLSISMSRIFELFFSYKVRFLAFSIVIILIGLFSYQQLFIINKLNKMERKIAIKSDETLGSIKTLSIINNKLLKEFTSGKEDEQIVLDKSSLDDFLEIYKDLKTEHDELIELLNENLKKLEKKLSKKDVQKLKQLLKEGGLEEKITINL